MPAALAWERDGLDWPHRDASRFVQAGGLRWHVQRFDPASDPQEPETPTVLLLHGTGSSTHSWRDVAPLLARHVPVVACDLPGHAFSAMPERGAASEQFLVSGMARAVADLLKVMGVRPALVAGHSAGAAVALRMCLDGWIAPRAVVGINAALMPWGGLAGQLVSPAARLMAATSLVPRLFAWRASDPAVLRRLVGGTGSTLDATGLALYGRLVRDPGHAAAALAMMAQWDLHSLMRDMPRLNVPLQVVVGACDRTVSPREASRVQAMVPAACRLPVISLPGLGHLAHEERPDAVAAILLERLGVPVSANR
ncbi:alpha/beta fold hydrolase BchO [Ramlibacter sp.]|uniref:alpha/beta fold hydrolase BchO n=1 Tax=Ramlibacter sp. TaxID=1917967 RepID=UPI003D0D3B22